MHLVTCVYFRSHNKDGGYTIRSTVPENPMLHANITALCLTERDLLPIEVLHCGNRNFRPFWLLWPWPWPNDLQIRTRPVVRRYILHVHIWTSYVKVFESYRLKDRQTRPKLYTTLLRGWSINSFSTKAKVFCVPKCLHVVFEYLNIIASRHFFLLCVMKTVSQKKGAPLTMAVTSSILDRFAKFFHCCK